MYQELINKQKNIGVIGLGYVGLPIALEFAKHFKVIGFDINKSRVEMMQNHVDPSNELDSSEFKNKDITFTDDIEVLRTANFYIVAVPTPVDDHCVPDLTPVLAASRTIGKVLKKGDYVIFESTVYPGCTEEDCLPVIEQLSGLKLNVDYKAGYSPERINPGDKTRPIHKILKIVSGSDAESLEEIAKVYGQIIEAGLHKATSIKVAEAAKVIENAQRDVNIAFMNELSMIFDKLEIDTHEVLEAAGTKWNFIKLSPGLVGGHCIGVDPYYLTYKAMQMGYNPQVILSGRRINDDMPEHIAKKTVQMLIKQGKDIKHCKVLVLGITFKENVSDIRNSKVANLVKALQNYSLQVDIYDPNVDHAEVKHEYGLSMVDTIGKDYDAIVLAVAHDVFRDFSEEYLQEISKQNLVFIDIKGMFKSLRSTDIKYWSL
ncbi:MAG: nucleotide sugar dehydrogenase [Saprospiraceae bacterium]|nr:nucleotide sugar dehydrogenase [Saprospiraceae bacterium]